jgi:putative SOS response-associated peptidase YedK
MAMCGRMTQVPTWSEIHAWFALTDWWVEPQPETLPQYPDIVPSAQALVLRPAGDHQLGISSLRWGLVPAWSKQPKTRYSAFNARAEDIANKPTFRSAVRARRCLVPASSWWEWSTQGRVKVPHRFLAADGGLLVFAGVWEHWQDDTQSLDSFAIVTSPAQGAVAEVHDRMPVVLDPHSVAAWLDPKLGDPEAFALAMSAPELEVRAGDGPPARPHKPNTPEQLDLL